MLILRNVEVDGRGPLDVRLEGGRVAEIGAHLRGGEEVEGRGGALLPGLHDHHIHVLATAAKAASIDLTDVSAAALGETLARALAAFPTDAWVRAVGYHEHGADVLDRAALDAIAPRHKLRVQHRSGALWVLNSAALHEVLSEDAPVERDGAGRPTGRVWRADAWLRTRLSGQTPPLAPLGRALASLGVTGLMDASVTTDAGAASLLAHAARIGDLPQRLALMSGEALAAPADGAFAVGPVKILFDEHELPSLDIYGAQIAAARAWRRPVAVHCVTAAELALTLAAFASFGARPGDRIEHGSIIPAASIEVIKRLGLTVVTQSGFVGERGDRYLAEVPAHEQGDLYRCASLVRAGIPVAGSSDAPYGCYDPWTAMRTARDRLAPSGAPVARRERIDAHAALNLYLGALDNPGGAPRRVEVGAPADLVLLHAPLRDALHVLHADLVAATIIGGRVV